MALTRTFLAAFMVVGIYIGAVIKSWGLLVSCAFVLIILWFSRKKKEAKNEDRT